MGDDRKESPASSQKPDNGTDPEYTQNSLLGSAIDGISDIFILLDQDLKLVHCNRAFLEETGSNRSEICGQLIVNHLPDFLDASVIDHCRTALQTNGASQLVTRRENEKTSEFFEIDICPTTAGIVLTAKNVSKKIETEMALIESEERFRMVFRASPDAFIITRMKDGVIVDLNRSFCDITGYNREEVIGHKYSDLDIWADRRERHRFMKTLRSGQEIENLDLKFRMKDGKTVHGLISTSVSELNGDRFLLCIAKSIEEQKQIESELITSKENMERYLKIAAEIILTLDGDGSIRILNENGHKLLGYENGTLIGKNWFDNCIPEQHRDNIKDVFDRLLKGEFENARSFENNVLLKDGTEKTIRWHNSVLNDEYGQIIGTLSSGEDISERKQMEAALKLSEERFRALVETTSDLIWALDEDAVFTYASPRIQDILGYQPDEVIGKTPFDLMEPDEAKRNWRVFEELKSKGAAVTTHENVNIHKNGYPVVIETSGQPFYDANGKLIGYRGIDRDITKRKQAERIMIKASRMEATATLAAGIAHDFNNLMVGVLGNAELLKMYFDAKPDALEKIDAIADSARKAGQLGQQLLAFARGGKYQPRVLNLNDIIQDALRLNERSFPPRIRIERDIEPDLLNIMGDFNQINQVIINLCINSVEAIENNGRIILTTRNIELDDSFCNERAPLKAGKHVYLSVEDTGSGIDNEIIGKIFEPFFSTKFQGRGLGLAAVYGIIQKHNGYIVANSQQGISTVFEIYLPAVALEKKVQEKKKGAIPTGNETILVIDDEKIVLDVARNILESLGYRVLLANHGQEAVEIVDTFDGEIHLALLDMGMPVMGGVEAFPLLRKSRPDMRIIICSGYEKDRAVQKLLQTGADVFIQKPFRLSEFGHEIREILDRQAGSSEAE